jgi:hypothetical protein
MSQPAGCMAGSISLRRDQYACDGGISYTSGSLARELFTRFHVGDRSVRELRVCDGATEGEMKGSFQEMIRTRFELLWCRACLTSTVGISVSSMSPNLAGEWSVKGAAAARTPLRHPRVLPFIRWTSLFSCESVHVWLTH